MKVENCAPPNSLQHVGLADVGERRVDADQIVGLRPLLELLLARSAAARGSVLALRIFWAMVSASSVRLMRDWSDGSDFDIFLVPSRSDITRVAGPWISGSGSGKNAVAEAVAADRVAESRC